MIVSMAGAGDSQPMAPTLAGLARALRAVTLPEAIALAGDTVPRRTPEDHMEGTSTTVVTDVGELELPSDDQVVLPWLREYGTWEPAEHAVVAGLLRPGMCFLDIGAHVGYYSVLASPLVGSAGRVISLEPEPRNFRLLARNLVAHGAFNARPLPAGAWSETRTLSLSRSDTNSGDHQVSPDRVAGAVEVACVRLDDLLAGQRVDVVKTDVQGADHHALRGMAELIRLHRPAIVTEFWPLGIRRLGDRAPDVFASYQRLGYAISTVPDGGAPDLDVTDLDGEAVEQLALGTDGGFLTLLMRPPGVRRRRRELRRR
jgi:FkbM family methyltransferase